MLRRTLFTTAIVTGIFAIPLRTEPVAAQSPAPPAVLVQPATARSLTVQSEYIGRVKAREKVELRARVGGFLGPRLFKDGDRVKEDQILFKIEREPFEVTVEQRRARVAAAEATLTNARLQLERAQVLMRTQSVSQAILDERAAAEGRAQADHLEAAALLREAEIQLSYTDIKTPISGTVGRALVSPGNLVGPESGVLATVVQSDPVDVLFPVTQRELIEARRQGGGAEFLLVRARLADGSFYDEKGRINFIDIVVDPRTDGQIVRAVFANPNGFLSDGQTVRIVIEEKEGAKVVAIPQAAVALDQTGPYAFVVAADNKVEQRRLRLGAVRDGLVGVEDGIKEGDRVVVQGQQRIRAGMTVAPETLPAPAR